MSEELTHDIIDNVLKTLQSYCACREDCLGCRYGIPPRPGRVFMTCILSGSPLNWEVEKIGGYDDERS